MDKINNGLENNIKIEAVEAVAFLRYSGNFNTKKVVFGNTGLDIDFDLRDDRKMESFFDFTPEGSFGFHKDTAVKNASILRIALLGVYDFLNDTDTLKRWDLEIDKIGETSATTNKRLVHAIKNLFSDHGHPEIVKTNRHSDSVAINLSIFGKLDMNDSLIVHLKRVKERNKGLLVKKTNLIYHY